MVKEKSCGTFIVKKEEDLIKIILIRHNDGHWGFPKGHMEKGETEIETAVRETKEETNLDVTIISDFLKKVTYSPREGVIKDVIYYLGIPSGSVKIDNNEIIDYKWIDINKVEEYIDHKDHIEVINDLRKFIKKLN